MSILKKKTVKKETKKQADKPKLQFAPVAHVFVTGDLGFQDYKRVNEVLDELSKDRELRIYGCYSPGSESYARNWAKAKGVPFLVVPPNPHTGKEQAWKAYSSRDWSLVKFCKDLDGGVLYFKTVDYKESTRYNVLLQNCKRAKLRMVVR